MGIPNFNLDGILPEGIHNGTLDEIKEYFCGFGNINVRTELFNSLNRYVKELKKHRVSFEVILDGSYVTSKECPDDLDVLVFYDFEYNNSQWLELISDKTVPFRFQGLQIFPDFLESFGRDDLLDFAEGVRGKPDKRKGLIRVVI